jgi:hypothetical protein
VAGFPLLSARRGSGQSADDRPCIRVSSAAQPGVYQVSASSPARRSSRSSACTRSARPALEHRPCPRPTRLGSAPRRSSLRQASPPRGGVAGRLQPSASHPQAILPGRRPDVPASRRQRLPRRSAAAGATVPSVTMTRAIRPDSVA